jgi:glyoxylase-like metal-dependent hydrolase (beta-lactamase superfamily II)
VNIGRNVTVIRLVSGRLVIHSTAPFTDADIVEIRKLGEPGWLVEGMVDHDTFSAAGRKAFPEIPFLAPAGFQKRVDFAVDSLNAPPAEWLPELEVVRIDGAPKMAECVLFHHPTGTLIVCDLLFHFPDPPSLWAKLVLTMVLGRDPAPGFSKRLKMAIEDRLAFSASLEKVLALPIKRIVPGHGDVMEKDAKIKAERLSAIAGLIL